MSERPDSGSDEFSVRLAWPKPGAAEPTEPADAAAKARPTRPDAGATRPADAARPGSPGGPSIPSPPGAPAPASPTSPGASAPAAAPGTKGPAASKGPALGGVKLRPGGSATTDTPASAPGAGGTATSGGSGSTTDLARAPRPTTGSALELVPPSAESTRMGRVFVEAFDRLADRLLERLRSLRQDVDADLAALRSELSSLRQAVDDVGDRVQLRQLRTTLDELRADVTGLRRAVLEWPELDQITNDIAAVRADLAFLYETGIGGSEGAQAPSELLVELQAAVATLSERAQDPMLDQPQLAVLAPLVEEVASVRGELTSIRRRMVLRASPLDEEQLEQIVSAVAARVVEELHAGDGGRRSRRR